MKNVKIIKELHRIANTHGGLLNPETVVQVAKNPKSVLHSKFEWNDGEAAHEYRLWQARQLISVCVEVVPGTNTVTDAFVSLTSDRGQGRGYRVMATVLNDSQMREQLLADAMADMSRFQAKYHQLRQLSEVFAAIRKVRKKTA